tara:strand:- start:1388 stop:3406 length:2019 start_codon:yes stop_codon:yes gene_type:complete
MALPNPNKELVGQSQTQTLTLKDLLFYQKETEKWSQNTDVNTYRGYVQEQESAKDLEDTIKELQLGSEGSLKSVTEEISLGNRSIKESFSALGGAIFKPLQRLSVNLNKKSFQEFGESMFSATDIVSRGSERVKSGFKELTNGIGALGPVINTIRTGIFKAVAVVNLLVGGFQLLFGVLAKSAQSFLRYFGFDMGAKEEALKEQLKTNAEKTQAEADEAEERLQASKEALEAQQEKERQLDESNLPLPVDVTNQAGAPVEAKQPDRGVLLGDGVTFSKDAEIAEQKKEESDKLSQLAKEMEQNETDLANKRKANEKAQNLLEQKNEKKRAKGFKGLIARLNLFSMMGMLKFLGFAGLLAGIIMGLKNNVPGMITGVTEVVRRGAVGLTRMVDKRIVQPFKKFTGIGVPKPAAGIPGDMVPKGAKPFEFEGKTYKAGDQLPKDVKMNADGTAKRMSGTPKTPPKPGVAKNIGKVASKALTPVAGIVETGLDIRDNSQKFESVKAAYEAGIPFIPDGAGGKRPMTKEEFELLEKAQKANFAGSFGRGAGAVGGAVAGAAALSWLGPFGLVVGGIGGAIIGARAGDDAATGLAEVFTGTENSQDMLNNLADALPEQPAEAIEEVQTEISNTRAMPQQQPAGVFNQQQVVNNQNNETISVGQTPFSNVQLEYSYGD